MKLKTVQFTQTFPFDYIRKQMSYYVYKRERSSIRSEGFVQPQSQTSICCPNYIGIIARLFQTIHFIF